MEHPEFPQPMCDIYLEKEIWSINIKREKKIRVTSWVVKWLHLKGLFLSNMFLCVLKIFVSHEEDNLER